MPHARLLVTLPDAVWVGRLSRRHPAVTFEVLAALQSDGVGVGLVELSGPDLTTVVGEMEAADGVDSVSIVGTTPDEAVVQFETSEPLLLSLARDSGFPLTPPVPIRAGEATIDVTVSRDRLAAMVDQLDEVGLAHEVAWIRESVDPETLLTDRQRELVVAAVEAGYYDTPRSCSLTALAEDLDLAASTASETLHRAEGKILKEFVADLPTAPDSLRE
jgi:hypothetical protein